MNGRCLKVRHSFVWEGLLLIEPQEFSPILFAFVALVPDPAVCVPGILPVFCVEVVVRWAYRAPSLSVTVEAWAFVFALYYGSPLVLGTGDIPLWSATSRICLDYWGVHAVVPDFFSSFLDNPRR